MKILVADRHSLVRKGLKQILLEHGVDVELLEAENIEELIDLAREDVGLILVDRSWLEEGLKISDLLKRTNAAVILLLAANGEESEEANSVEGISGCLSKDGKAGDLWKSIHRVLQSLPELPGPASLSDREYQVLRYFVAGKSQKEIGDLLSISAKTVGTYRRRILLKTGISTNAELIRYAMALGIQDIRKN